MPRHPDPMPAATPIDAQPRRPGSSLLIRELLNRVRSWAPCETITYRQQEPVTYAQWLARVDRLGGLLQSLGVQPGERIGVLDWDSHRYLDLYFAVSDAKWGECPHAEVVLRPETAGAVTTRDLQKHLKTEIDGGTLHQRAILMRVAWAEALPRTSVGKIDKKALRARLTAAAAGTLA
jgi:acyl-CoA synthetase (AMP-forming)/AMP-acid ligase II